MTAQGIRDRYFELLKAYVNKPSEAHLAEAADLGRELVQANIPPEEIAEIHEQALTHLAQGVPDITLSNTATPCSLPLVELLMAYGLGFRKQYEDQKRTEEELRGLLQRLENYKRLTIGRELRMIELKREINELLKELGCEEKYLIVPRSAT